MFAQNIRPPFASVGRASNDPSISARTCSRGPTDIQPARRGGFAFGARWEPRVCGAATAPIPTLARPDRRIAARLDRHSQKLAQNERFSRSVRPLEGYLSAPIIGALTLAPTVRLARAARASNYLQPRRAQRGLRADRANLQRLSVARPPCQPRRQADGRPTRAKRSAVAH